MPELPEVQALVDFLGSRIVGLAVTGVELGSISVLKTYDPPPSALVGAPVDGVARHGKFLDLDVDGTHLVFHLARAGWLRWSDALPATVIRPGKSPIALRVRLSDGSGFDLTEAGTKKSLAAYLVRDVALVPGIARLGPDPLAESFTEEAFAALLAGRRTQIKGLLRDQAVIAGVGNVYRAEVLFRHRVAPMTPGRQVRPRTWLAIWEDLVALLPLGVAFGQIITLPEQEAAARALLARGQVTVDWQGGFAGLKHRCSTPKYRVARGACLS